MSDVKFTERLLEDGESLRVGCFYRSCIGRARFWAPLKQTGDQVLTECAWRPPDEKDWTTSQYWYRVKGLTAGTYSETHDMRVWEISVEEYEANVGHVPKMGANVTIHALDVVCPSCDEPVRNPNRRITMRDHGVSVVELLRHERCLEGPTMPLVFDGCVRCLEQRLAGNPAAMWLLREWLRRTH